MKRKQISISLLVIGLFLICLVNVLAFITARNKAIQVLQTPPIDFIIWYMPKVKRGLYSTIEFFGLLSLVAAAAVRLRKKEHWLLVLKIAILASPLLLFAVLYTPYRWVNRNFIVDWLGCGCNVNTFNANDFTDLFWLFISACTTLIAVLLSKKIPREKMWLRILYVIGFFSASLLISRYVSSLMEWL